MTANEHGSRTTEHQLNVRTSDLLRSTHERHDTLVPAGPWLRPRTFPSMPTTPRRVPTRLLLPRDYLAPHQFGIGTSTSASAHLPEGGDVESLRAAVVQHHLARTLVRHARTGTGPGSELGRLFGFSRQHWSDCLAGRTWMRERTLLAAHALLLGLVDELPDPPYIEESS